MFVLGAVLTGAAACVLPGGGGTTGERGIPVAQAATILRAAADAVDNWDLNDDGLLDAGEATAAASSVAATIAAAISEASRKE